MKECDILGGQNILWPPTYFHGVKTPNPQDLRPCIRPYAVSYFWTFHMIFISSINATILFLRYTVTNLAGLSRNGMIQSFKWDWVELELICPAVRPDVSYLFIYLFVRLFIHSYSSLNMQLITAYLARLKDLQVESNLAELHAPLSISVLDDASAVPVDRCMSAAWQFYLLHPMPAAPLPLGVNLYYILRFRMRKQRVFNYTLKVIWKSITATL